ncbi:MAG: hypothetical protein F6J86_37795 [Symploca sp. SIO1B1]|nr:hypothetical protein [Symploca sp. SIO1A3]NER99508.1 hypothetical protein [Symploca sp. SIO1B1]
MNPIELLSKYHWSYQKLAVFFGVSEQSARRWNFRDCSSNYRKPSKTAQILAAVVDAHPEVWETIQSVSFQLKD